MELPEQLFSSDGRFRYTDFLDFLRTYDLAASVIRTGEDYRDITYEYLGACAAGGAIYVELTASPDHAGSSGSATRSTWPAISQGIDDARRDTGIEGRILVSAVRNFGVEQALRVARDAAEHPHPYVVGFSMAGDEAELPGARFRRGVRDRRRRRAWAARSTRASGRARRASAPRSSFRSPASPWRPRDRGPGARGRARGARDGARHAARRATSCLASIPRYEEHPLPDVREAGVKVTLGSDDPPYFGATIEGEYEVCAERMGFGEDDLRDVTLHRDRRRVLRRGPARGAASSGPCLDSWIA